MFLPVNLKCAMKHDIIVAREEIDRDRVAVGRQLRHTRIETQGDYDVPLYTIDLSDYV